MARMCRTSRWLAAQSICLGSATESGNENNTIKRTESHQKAVAIDRTNEKTGAKKMEERSLINPPVGGNHIPDPRSTQPREFKAEPSWTGSIRSM